MHEIDKGTDIKRIIQSLESKVPNLRWEQLKVSHPGADDDGIWFFSLEGLPGEVQIESWNGMLPFLVETDKHNDRVICNGCDEVVETVQTWLLMPCERS